MSKQKDAPAFDFYPERWLVGTASLSDQEQICYLRLLCHQWVMEGLPADVGALKRLAGKGITDAVLAKLPVGDDGKRRNNRLEIVRKDQRARIEKSRAKIQRMNEARTGKNKEKAPLQEPLQEGLQEPLVDALQGAPHHSPLTTHPTLGTVTFREAPCTVEEAWAYANGSGIGITREGVEIWHAKNQDAGWMVFPANGPARPVTDWRARLRGAVAWIREEIAKAQAAERRAGPGAQSKSFRQQDQDAKEQARHGVEKITPKILTLEG